MSYGSYYDRWTYGFAVLVAILSGLVTCGSTIAFGNIMVLLINYMVTNNIHFSDVRLGELIGDDVHYQEFAYLYACAMVFLTVFGAASFVFTALLIGGLRKKKEKLLRVYLVCGVVTTVLLGGGVLCSVLQIPWQDSSYLVKSVLSGVVGGITLLHVILCVLANRIYTKILDSMQFQSAAAVELTYYLLHTNIVNK